MPNDLRHYKVVKNNELLCFQALSVTSMGRLLAVPLDQCTLGHRRPPNAWRSPAGPGRQGGAKRLLTGLDAWRHCRAQLRAWTRPFTDSPR